MRKNVKARWRKSRSRCKKQINISYRKQRLKKLIIETQCTAKANKFTKKRLRLIQKQLVHYEVGMETERTCWVYFYGNLLKDSYAFIVLSTKWILQIKSMIFYEFALHMVKQKRKSIYKLNLVINLFVINIYILPHSTKQLRWLATANICTLHFYL